MNTALTLACGLCAAVAMYHGKYTVACVFALNIIAIKLEEICNVLRKQNAGTK